MSEINDALKMWADSTQEWEKVEKVVEGLVGEDLMAFIRAARGMYLTNYDLYLTWKNEAKLLQPRKLN